MKKGISDAMFVPNWSTEKFLKTAKKVGFEGVELNFREEGGELTPETTLEEAKALAKLANDIGIEVATLTTGLLNDYALTSNNTKDRERGIEIAMRMIELAEVMGVKIIQLVPGTTCIDTPYGAGYNNAAEALSLLGDRAASAGITIGIENVCNHFLPSPGEFAGFLDKIDHPAVQAYFDNGNALRTGHIEHYLDLLGDRIVAMHVKDYRVSSADFVSILDGDTDWPKMMKALRDIPYEGYLIATPHHPYKHCHDRLIAQYSDDLTAVIELANKVNV